MDDAYTEKNYTKEWKRKRNDYTIKYNAKMTNNIEMKIISVKGKEKRVANMFWKRNSFSDSSRGTSTQTIVNNMDIPL